MKLDYLTNEGKDVFSKHCFKTPLTAEEKARLNAIENLTPGEVRVRSGLREDGEAPVVDDKLLPRGPERHGPADVRVARPQMVDGRAPDHEREPLPALGLEDDTR